MNLFFFDNSYRNKGYNTIAGIDEAGRGPWAGPVVAAAVVLPSSAKIKGLNDSKKLTPFKREKIFDEIKKVALAIGIEIVNQDIIDSINILKATHLAMRGALHKINLPIDLVLIDGRPVPDFKCPQKAIVRGDEKSASIAAASIVAKVTRDKIMVELSNKYPNYNFHRHKGYGTKEHYYAILKYGPCPLHRKSFNPVQAMLDS